MPIDPTCDPSLRSFLDVPEDSDFPIQNLPYGVFAPRDGGGRDGAPRVGVAIGERVLDLALLEAEGKLRVPELGDRSVFDRPSLNAFMACGRPAWSAVRRAVSALLRHDEPTLRDDADLRRRALHRQADVTMLMPVDVRDYTDFYSSREHATNVGTMFRGPENALMENWLHLPVAYHGRASSVILSGREIQRPKGQTKPDGADSPVFGASKLLDFELEMGFFVGTGNALGAPISVVDAEEHIFGMCLVNDWSARDIQKWEYQPLGPFLAKNFATSISPWIVTMEALEPFRCQGPRQDPEPLPYLAAKGARAFDIQLEVLIRTEKSGTPERVCLSNFKYLYWSMAQQLAHHTITGCNTATGDLMASGTISGPDPENFGSMLEIAWRGSRPVKLASGEERKFILDGDTVIMRGWCAGEGYRVGFGEVSTRVLPATE